MIKTHVCYVAHPVGTERRADNILIVKAWLPHLLITAPHLAFAIPWLPYVETLEETTENRTRGIRDDLAQLELCHAILALGPAFSPGMRAEWDHAGIHGLIRIDATGLGAWIFPHGRPQLRHPEGARELLRQKLSIVGRAVA